MESKKMIVLCAVVILVIAGIGIAVYNSSDNNDKKNDVEEIRTITDMSGNAVKLPAASELQRVVVLAPPMITSVLHVIDGNRIIGANPMAFMYCDTSVMDSMFPTWRSVNTSFVTTSFVINVESLLNLEPDVILYASPMQIQGIENIGIPLVSFFSTFENFDTEPLTVEWDKLLREVFDVDQENALQGAWDDADKLAETLVKKVSEKKTVMGLMNYTGTLMVSGPPNTTSPITTAFTKASLTDVAPTTLGPVTMEKILEWNPDIIVVFGTKGLAAQMLANTVDGQDWSNTTAFKTGQIYDAPCGGYSWYTPSSDSLLMQLWLISEAYPDIYSHSEMKQYLYDYYSDYYGVKLTSTQLASILGY